MGDPNIEAATLIANALGWHRRFLHPFRVQTRERRSRNSERLDRTTHGGEGTD